MTELFNLPDKPATITPADMTAYVAAHHANLPCEACSAEQFTMCPEKSGAAGEARGVVWLACDACNSLRTFLRPPVVAWLRSSCHR